MRNIKLLALALFILFQCDCYCQNPIIQYTAPQAGSGPGTFIIKVDSLNTGLGKIISPDAFRQKGVRRTLPFLETGDGAFYTEEIASHELKTQKYPSFLFAAAIYDTTRPKAATRLGSLKKIDEAATDLGTTLPSFSTNTPPLLKSGKKIMLASNVSDIVQGDYTNFVLTYKLPDTSCNLALGCEYRIVVFYNDKIVFNTINPLDQLPNGADQIRLFYEDQVTNVDKGDILIAAKANININFQNKFTVVCGFPSFSERNLFFTTYTGLDVPLNTVTSLYAVLLRSQNGGQNWTIIGDYLIDGMPVRLAHDPNFITQTGQCLKLPKKSKTIDYHVHFQNDGEGSAGRVVVKIKLPPGITNENIKFGSANCGGKPFTLTKDNTQFDKPNYTLVVSFDSGNGNLPVLMGTYGNVNPSINTNTMGDIFFSVKETVILCDTLPAYADIYFFNLGSDTPLPPIRTNMAKSIYREYCDNSNIVFDCDTTNIWHKQIKPIPDPCKTCFTLLWICWYWWLLLIPLFWIGYRVYKKYTSNTDSK